MQKIGSNSKVTKAADYVEANVDGELVLMHTVSGRFFSLSDTALRIWELVGDGIVIDQLIERLVGEFEITAEECERDVVEMIEGLKDRSLVIVS